MLGSVESEMVRLISRQIIFADFQPITIPHRYRQTDRQTDRQLVLAIPLSAKASRGNEATKRFTITRAYRRILFVLLSLRAKESNKCLSCLTQCHTCSYKIK